MPVAFRYLAPFVLVFTIAPATPGTPSPQDEAARRIDVTARRFAFEPSVIEVSAGERIELAIRSADGVHGIEIRQLKVKRQIPRGDTLTRIAFTAPEPGRYPIVCSEYCGADHDDMKGTLVVQAAQR